MDPETTGALFSKYGEVALKLRPNVANVTVEWLPLPYLFESKGFHKLANEIKALGTEQLAESAKYTLLEKPEDGDDYPATGP